MLTSFHNLCSELHLTRGVRDIVKQRVFLLTAAFLRSYFSTKSLLFSSEHLKHLIISYFFICNRLSRWRFCKSQLSHSDEIRDSVDVTYVSQNAEWLLQTSREKTHAEVENRTSVKWRQNVGGYIRFKAWECTVSMMSLHNTFSNVTRVICRRLRQKNVR